MNESRRLGLGLAYSQGRMHGPLGATSIQYTYGEEGVVILTDGSKGSHGYPLVTGSLYAPHAGDTR